MSTTAQLKDVATGTTVAKVGPPKDFPAMLIAWRGEIARALPKHLNADRMGRIALTCFRNVPRLAECDPKSVFAAVIQAAQLGIEPGLLGEAHIVPFGKEAQLIPGYQGLIKLAKQTGQVVDIYAVAVREKDTFRCTYGLTRTLEHTPLPGLGGFPAKQTLRGEIVGVYAVAVFKDSTRTFVAVGRDETDRIRDQSRGYQAAKKFKKETPWDTHYEEMALKTAIRRLCKTLPKSPELAQALALEDAHYRGERQNINLDDAIDATYQPPVTDEPVDVDHETGEIMDRREQSPASSSPGEPVKGDPNLQAAIATGPRDAPEGFTLFNECQWYVQDGQYDRALQIAGKELQPSSQAQLHREIAAHKAQAQLPV